jgi:hypothetical protein
VDTSLEEEENMQEELMGTGWIHLALDRDQCWALVNMVIGSMKCGEFLSLLSNYQLLKKYTAPWS